jgi:hypothetical protein
LKVREGLLGAGYVIDVNKVDPLAPHQGITGQQGSTWGSDCTAGRGTIHCLLRASSHEAQGPDQSSCRASMPEFRTFPIGRSPGQSIYCKSARGPQLQWPCGARRLAAACLKRFPLEKITTHRFGLKDVDLAIKSVGGHGVPDVIHASLMPWMWGAERHLDAVDRVKDWTRGDSA